jgi:hypothetical protein
MGEREEPSQGAAASDLLRGATTRTRRHHQRGEREESVCGEGDECGHRVSLSVCAQLDKNMGMHIKVISKKRMSQTGGA